MKQLDLLAAAGDRVVEAVRGLTRAPRPVLPASTSAAPTAPVPRSENELVWGATTLHVHLRGRDATRLCDEIAGELGRASPFSPRPRCRRLPGGEVRVTMLRAGLSPVQVEDAAQRARVLLRAHKVAFVERHRPSSRHESPARDALAWVGPPPRGNETDVRPYVAEFLGASFAGGDVARVRPAPVAMPHAPFTFWTGTHEASWLGRTNVPLFISRRRFYDRATEQLARRLPRAQGPWALDSGGFTEIASHRHWRISGSRYAREVRRLRDEVGQLVWAAPQDWMVEPDVIRGTGLTVRAHQYLTTYSIVALRLMDPDLPIVPVLQGWTMDDYLRHRDLYARAGLDLTREPLVGVGTMCRRTECPTRIANMLRRLRSEGVARMHAFGVKTEVLARGGTLQDRRQGTFEPMLAETNGGRGWLGDILASADSLAWSEAASIHARTAKSPAAAPMIPGHVHGRTNACNNCFEWALVWRRKVLDAAGVEDAPGLFWRAARTGEDMALPAPQWSLG